MGVSCLVWWRTGTEGRMGEREGRGEGRKEGAREVERDRWDKGREREVKGGEEFQKEVKKLARESYGGMIKEKGEWKGI